MIFLFVIFFCVRLLYIVQINKFAYLEAWMTALNFENWFSSKNFGDSELKITQKNCEIEINYDTHVKCHFNSLVLGVFTFGDGHLIMVGLHTLVDIHV